VPRNATKTLPSLQARNYIRSLQKMEKKDFHEVFRGANPLGESNTLSASLIMERVAKCFLANVFNPFSLLSHRLVGEDVGVGRG